MLKEGWASLAISRLFERRFEYKNTYFSKYTDKELELSILYIDSFIMGRNQNSDFKTRRPSLFALFSSLLLSKTSEEEGDYKDINENGENNSRKKKAAISSKYTNSRCSDKANFSKGFQSMLGLKKKKASYILEERTTINPTFVDDSSYTPVKTKSSGLDFSVALMNQTENCDAEISKALLKSEKSETYSTKLTVYIKNSKKKTSYVRMHMKQRFTVNATFVYLPIKEKIHGGVFV